MTRRFHELLYDKMTHARSDEWKRENLAAEVTRLGQELFGPEFNLSERTLYQYARDPARDGLNCPPETAMLIYRATGDIDLLNHLMRLAGDDITWFRLPDAVLSEMTTARTAMQSGKEHSEFLVKFFDAHEDGYVTPDEADMVYTEGMQAIRAIRAGIILTMLSRKPELDTKK